MGLLRAMKELQVAVSVAILVIALTFAATPSAQGQTFKTLYEFTEQDDGRQPRAGVTAVVSPGGNITLYGTALYGGNLKCNVPLGCGTVFKVTLEGDETVLHRFAGGSDGALPYSAPIIDAKGNLYATTSAGGGASGCLGSGCGTVLKLSFKGKENVLYTFTGGTDGGMPFTGLVADKKGNRFGTTTFGGNLSCGIAPPGCGTFFKIDPTGKVTVEYSFLGKKKDGAFPMNDPITKDGLWYYFAEGSDPPNGRGAVVRFNDSTKTLERLHIFHGPDGADPISGVVVKNGFVYGTASGGGPNHGGVVFQLDLSKKTFRLLHSFGINLDGAIPLGAVTFDQQGNLYGTTERGGKFGNGTLYKIDTKGNESDLHDFDFSTGALPIGPVTFVPKCKCIFGTTAESSQGYGTVWQFIL
jgi:uncharacterized repeat protein (TIGR03803 family)